jgi:hypothetical protein
MKNINSVNFFNFSSSKLWIRIGIQPCWIRIGIQPKMLDPDPDSMNPDQKHCPNLIRIHKTDFSEGGWSEGWDGGRGGGGDGGGGLGRVGGVRG